MTEPTTSPPTPTALVTGASGFLATQIILVLAARGYRVVAAVRSPAKADAWRRRHPSLCAPAPPPSGPVELVVVPDMQRDGAYDDAAAAADVVFHAASPFHFAFADNERDMLAPARAGARSVLASAARSPRVRRVVFTSSFAAVTSPHLDPRPGYTYTEDDWNPVEWQEAVDSRDAHFVYLASKTFAEQAVWEFARTQNPHFSITRRVHNIPSLLIPDIQCLLMLETSPSILPPIILGRAPQPYTSMADINQSSRVLHRLLDAPRMPGTPAYVSVDVEDCALCHVLAAESDAAAGRRYLAVGSSFSQQKAARVVAALFPEQAHRLPPAGAEEDHYGYSSARVEKDLGITWKPFEETVRETFQQLLDIEQRAAGRRPT